MSVFLELGQRPDEPGPPINGPGGCGGPDMVKLEAVILPDKSRVVLSPPPMPEISTPFAIIGAITPL